MQLRKIVLFISVLFIILSNPAYCSEFKIKIGIVDYKRILIKSQAGKSAIAKINNEAKKFKKLFKEKATEIEKEKNQLKTEAPILSQERRTDREQSLFQSINALRAFQKKSQMDLKRFQDELYAQIREEILQIAEEIGKNQNYFLILDRRNILYARNPADLTEDLIRYHNEKFLKR